MEMVFRECVNEARDRGQSVFLSSHILSEVEALCDRVGILSAGRLVDEGTLAELRHLSAQTVEVTFAGPAPALAPLDGVQVAGAGPNALRFEVSGSHRPADRRAGRASRGAPDEPRALARGDLPAPLRQLVSAAVRPASARGGVALARRAFGEARTRTLAFAGAVRALRLHPAGRLPRTPTRRPPTAWRSPRASPTTSALRLFYGAPHDLLERRRLHRVARRRDAGDRRRRLRAAGRGAGAAHRGGHRPHGGRPRRARRPAHDVPRGAHRDRGRHVLLWLARVRGLSRRRPPRGRIGLPGAGDGLRRAGLRGRRRGGVPAGPQPPRRAAARRSASWRCSSCCGWSRTRRAARSGCAGRRRWDGRRRCARSAARSRSSCCSRSWPASRCWWRPRRIDARARHRHRPAPRARHRAAAPGAALLAGRAGAAQRARRPDRVGGRRRAVRARSSASCRRASRRPTIPAGVRTRSPSSAPARSPRRPATWRSSSSSSCSRSASSRSRRSAPRATPRPSSSSRRCSPCPSAAASWLGGRLALAAVRRGR